MKTLFLAPQPFFQERGTPIAVRLALKVIAARKDHSGRGSDKIDLLTYHEGSDEVIPNVSLHRITAPSFLSDVGPGISFKKLICDLLFLFSAFRLVRQNRSKPYDLVHAVEESVFIAMLIKFLYGIPYIYDMDSSLALQVTEKWWILRPLYPLLAFFERMAVKNSLAVVPVCDALAAIADQHGSRDTHILRDISLMDLDKIKRDGNRLKREAGIEDSDLAILYIGNLEHYQGIDLLIESFAAIDPGPAHLVIIGGVEKHIEYYREKALQLGVSERVHLLGPRPVSLLGHYLLDADILASPRTLGNNTPMKIYSYLHSGRVTIATSRPTHTQVMDDSVALLCEPDTESFSAGLKALIADATLRERLGAAARKLAEEHYTFDVFSRRLNELYDRVDETIAEPPLMASA